MVKDLHSFIINTQSFTSHTKEAESLCKFFFLLVFIYCQDFLIVRKHAPDHIKS